MTGLERKGKSEWEKPWISSYIVDGIDRILLLDNSRKKEILAKNYVNMIIAPLVVKAVPPEIIEHLEIGFIRPTKPFESTNKDNETLRKIESILNEEFGDTVMSRLTLSIKDEKVRTIPR